MSTALVVVILALSIICIFWLWWQQKQQKNLLRVRVVLIALAIVALVSVYGNTFSDLRVKPYGKIDAWGIFHYYLGAKYFSEVNYESFYACAIEADKEGLKIWSGSTQVRNLNTYEIVSKSEIKACDKSAFSAVRWSEYVRDVGTLQNTLPVYQKQTVLTDKGFNPPPFWGVVMSWVANSIPLENNILAKTIFNLDFVFVLITIIVIVRHTNIETGMSAAIFLFLYIGTIGRLTGNFIQYGWLPVLMIGIAMYMKEKWGKSAFWLALSSLLQSFPYILIIAPGLKLLSTLKDAQKDQTEQKSFTNFFLYFGVWSVAGIIVGGLSQRGIGAWVEWLTKIRAHSHYLIGEIFNIGLKNLIATVTTPLSAVTKAVSYSEEYPNTLTRLLHFNSYAWIWYLAMLGVAYVLLVKVKSLPKREVLALGFIVMYVTLNLSPFYYVALVAIFLLFPLKIVAKSYSVVGSLLGLLLLQYLIMPYNGYVTFNTPEHVISETMIAMWIVIFLALILKNQKSSLRQDE